MTGKHDLLWLTPNTGPKEKQYDDDKTFQIHALQGEQHISGCAKYSLRVTAKQEDLLFDDFLGKTAQFTLQVGDQLGLKKTFTGIITAFTKANTCFGNLKEKAGVDCHYNYRIEIQPKLWLLTKKYNSRVFSYTSEEDLFKVVETVLKEHGIKYSRKKINKEEEKPHNDNKTQAGQEPAPAKVPPRPYQESRYFVQYRETDYAFVTRLLEEAGVWFYFDHEDDSLILCDDMADIPWVGPHRALVYSEDKSAYHKEGFEETLFDFYLQRCVGPNRFTLNDYGYETPTTDWLREKKAAKPDQIPELEHYEHTREYADKAQGAVPAMDKTANMLCETMLEESQTAHQVAFAVSTSRSLQAGYKFSLKNHWIDRYNGAWLVTSMTMSVHQRDYTVTLKAVPMESTFRPARKTPVPMVTSQQTATVVGPAGSEIYTDELGRCKLHFHWDKTNPKDDKASMWVRVANGYAGKDYGIQWIPRVGHEVLVSFIDGNPAHPVINGRVYNKTNTPPLSSARKYQNIIKTIKDNHILFDDRDGAELLDLRAQKDMNTLVLNNHTLTVGADAGESVGGNKTVSVNKDSRFYVEGFSSRWTRKDEITEVEEGDRCVTVKKGDYYTEVNTGDMITTVGGTGISVYRSGWEISVSGSDRYLDVHKDDIKWIGGNDYLKVDGGRTVHIGEAYKNEAKSYSLIAEDKVEIHGKSVTISADKEVIMQCGNNSITITPKDIQIQAIEITSTSVGTHKVSGGLVMIN